MKKIVLAGDWLGKYEGKKQYRDIIRAIMSLAAEYHYEVVVPKQHWN